MRACCEWVLCFWVGKTKNKKGKSVSVIDSEICKNAEAGDLISHPGYLPRGFFEGSC